MLIKYFYCRYLNIDYSVERLLCIRLLTLFDNMKFLYYPVIYRHEKYGWTTKLNTIRTTSLIFPRYRIIEKRRSSAVRFSEMRSLFEVMYSQW